MKSDISAVFCFCINHTEKLITAADFQSVIIPPGIWQEFIFMLSVEKAVGNEKTLPNQIRKLNKISEREMIKKKKFRVCMHNFRQTVGRL